MTKNQLKFIAFSMDWRTLLILAYITKKDDSETSMTFIVCCVLALALTAYYALKVMQEEKP